MKSNKLKKIWLDQLNDEISYHKRLGASAIIGALADHLAAGVISSDVVLFIIDNILASEGTIADEEAFIDIVSAYLKKTDPGFKHQAFLDGIIDIIFNCAFSEYGDMFIDYFLNSIKHYQELQKYQDIIDYYLN